MNLTNTVNKTEVSGSEEFTYTIELEFSNSNNAEIEIFMPSKISYTLPPINGNLKDIRKEYEDLGDRLIFDFEAVNNGEAAKFTILAKFDVGRVQNDEFTCLATLFYDDMETLESYAPTVNLTLEENYRISLSKPSGTTVKPGDKFNFELSLSNLGDGGTIIEDIDIECVLPVGLSFDLEQDIEGYDNSYKYKDEHLDGNVGVINDKVVSFDFDSYCGMSYKIKIPVIVDDDLGDLETLRTTGTWTVEGIDMNNFLWDLNVYKEKAEVKFHLFSEENTYELHDIKDTIDFSNSGTVDLEDVVIHYEVPSSVNLKHIKGGFREESVTSVNLYIKTNINPNETFISDLESYFIMANIDDTLSDGEYITDVIFKIDKMKASFYSGNFILFGVVKEGTVDDFMTNATFSANSSIEPVFHERTNLIRISEQTGIALYSNLNKYAVALNPTDKFRIEVTSICRDNYTSNPVYSILLPNEVKYLPGMESYTFKDNFFDIPYSSEDGLFPFDPPKIEIIDNYNDTGLSLLKVFFDGTKYYDGDNLNFRLWFAVAIGAENNFDMKVVMGDATHNARISACDSEQDLLDMDGDLNTEEFLPYDEHLDIPVLYTKDFKLSNLVKGNKNTDYITNGTTSEGGKVNYKISLVNNLDTIISDLEIIDILPSIDDTNVLNLEPRGSEFDVSLIKPLSTKVVNIITGEERVIEDVVYEYSISNNPVRYCESGFLIGDGEWITTAPLSDIRSIKINTPSGFNLYPYESLVTILECVAQDNVMLGFYAYNSYSIKGTVDSSDTTIKLNLNEPKKNSLMIGAPVYSNICGYTWNDSNKDGIKEVDEPGIYNSYIMAYDEDYKLVASTTSDESGFYELKYLFAGNYYLKFMEAYDYVLTKQMKSRIDGSKPDPDTCFTDLISIGPDEVVENIHAGFVKLGEPIIVALNKVIDLNTEFDPREGVTAFDSIGNNITNKIVVDFNNVNTTIEGEYKVIYSVTDDYGKSVTKEVTITVVDLITRDEAIVNIINSIAAEENALADILHSESLKIEKAKDMGLKGDALANINNSVTDMVNAINRLNSILVVKAELFTNNNE